MLGAPIYCSGSDPVTVNAGSTTVNINFQLDPPASISGTVYENDGITPVAGVKVTATYSPTSGYSNTTTSDINGKYTLDGLPSGFLGNFYVWASPSSGQNYIREIYNNALVYDDADLVTLSAGMNITGIDFSLDVGASISGSVYESNRSTPIAGIEIYACSISSEWYDYYYTTSDENGKYAISGLPDGDFRIWTHLSSDQNYFSEYYNNKENYDDADLVTISAGESVVGIDFYMDKGATISGIVYESDCVTPISGIYVSASREDCWMEYGPAVTDENGVYTIIRLRAGDYYLRAYVIWSSSDEITHIGEYYNNAAICDEADPVTVSAGEDIADINFQLDKSATISGAVTDSSGAGISDILVSAYPENEFTCVGSSGYYQYKDSTDENGAYTIFGMPAGDYYLRTYNFSQNYIREWYNNRAACDDADPVSVTAGENITNIDFQLDKGGTISGTIIDSSGAGIWAAHVQAYWGSDACNGEYLNSAETDTRGRYTIVGMPAGDIYIFQDGFSMGEMDYIISWYNNVLSCEEAVPVMVTVGSDTGGIDFQVIEITDYDRDRMPDQWEIHYFGDTTSSDGSGDVDGDGVTDLDEYLAGNAPIKIEEKLTDTENGVEDIDDDYNGGGCFIATCSIWFYP